MNLSKDFGVMGRLSEIGEASAKVYKYNVTYEEAGQGIQYEFTTDSKLKYQLDILHYEINRNKTRLIIAFKPVTGTYDTITNKGEQFKIMATVVSAVKEYLSKVPKAVELSFTPSKETEGDDRRANLYKAYIAKQLPGSKINIYSDGRYIITLPKKKMNELTERLELFLEKNVPNDPGKWSYYKSQAKKKFDVYPSAYANGWAAKMYKKAGGTWRKTNEAIDGKNMCKECAIKLVESLKDAIIYEAQYQGRTVTLNKPMSGDVKKYKVYVTNDKGNVVKVNFGYPNMQIKRDDPARRKSFRARHKCHQKKDKTSAGYWSCKMWSTKPVSKILQGK